ncbi:MAG: hypothetical protein ACYTGV_13455 [Planctomycetota bacterium]
MKKITLIGLLAFAACGQNAETTTTTTSTAGSPTAARADTREVQIRVRGMM